MTLTSLHARELTAERLAGAADLRLLLFCGESETGENVTHLYEQGRTAAGFDSALYCEPRKIEVILRASDPLICADARITQWRQIDHPDRWGEPQLAIHCSRIDPHAAARLAQLARAGALAQDLLRRLP